MWTVGRKIAMGFGLAFLLLLLVGTIAYRSIGSLVATNQWVTHTHDVLEQIAAVQSSLKEAESSQRGYLLTGNNSYLDSYRTAASNLPPIIEQIRQMTIDNPREQNRIALAESLVGARLGDLQNSIDARKKGDSEQIAALVAREEGSYEGSLSSVLNEMVQEERGLLQGRVDQAASDSRRGKVTIVLGTMVCLFFVAIAAFLINRSLKGQVGSAIRHVQSSSAELQSAANQQAAGARESSTAMSEITTTMSELLASSRQIAESARRVTQVTEETSDAARGGDAISQQTRESVNGLQRQVDLIVTHMLDLGRKSQQIGGILEIINELAEQTNILAINATIEASGAGEAGKRFGVVADEIRKLADRVGGSTKDIRTLIEEVRAAVNTTVMATEGGAKAVDAASRQFTELTTALRQIGDLLVSTTEATREIELSTKQQASAVEQVNVAVSNVAKSAKETEVSSNQTLQTAGQLAGLSRELMRLIQAAAAGA